MPPFEPSAYSDHELPGVVADVCRDYDPDDPQSVSQSQFDGHRANAGHPRAPSAKRIAFRLHLSWEATKELSLDPTRSTDRAIGKRVGADPDESITGEVCIAALRTVAAHLDEGAQLTPDAYTQEAARLLAANRRRYVHGGRLVLPTVGQIEWRLGRWPLALKKAGLTPPAARTDKEGMAVIDAIELCLETTGCLVAEWVLKRFFALSELSLQVARGDVTYPGVVAALRARRAETGKWTPPGYVTPRERPDLLTAVAGLSGRRRRRRTWDDERCIEYVTQFVRERRGLPQTQSDYRRWAATHPGAPSASAMRNCGRPGFAWYREEGRRRVREEETGQR